MLFYIASRFERYADARKVRRLIRGAGHEVQAQWLDRAGDKTKWQASDVAAQQDVDDLKAADMVLLLTSVPSYGYTTGGSHTEFGMALALDKPVAVLGRRENVFHHLPNVRQFETPGQLVDWLRQEGHNGQPTGDTGIPAG